MTKRFLPIILWVVLLVPSVAFADVSEEEFWLDQGFLYQIDIATVGDALTGSYKLTTGDEPVGSGDWEVAIIGPLGQRLTEQRFAVRNGSVSVLVRYQPSGTAAEVYDASGSRVLSLSLLGSRVCNQDGLCDAEYGEVTTNCPADCGAYAGPDQTATIVRQAGAGKKVGSILMGLAMAAMGVLLIRGVGGILDRRYHA